MTIGRYCGQASHDQTIAVTDDIRHGARVAEIDPLSDERWPRFLERHKLASVFHTREWLEALYRTYAYAAGAVVIESPDGELSDAVAFCRVDSRVTGFRIVSVPFSDQCAPLVQDGAKLRLLVDAIKGRLRPERGEYFEIRPYVGDLGMEAGLSVCANYCYHRLDLRPTLGDLYRGFHGDCIRRKIRRAERAKLSYEEGRSAAQLHQFYKLAVLTRRRLGLPPQPLKWYENLVTCLGEKLKIRIAYHGATPAAAIMTIRHKTTMLYKYGCSDPRFHHLGSVQLVMWNALQEAKSEGLLEFDFGRSDWIDEGLIQFKDRWGAERSVVRYWRYPGADKAGRLKQAAMGAAKRIFAHTPGRLLAVAGNLLYRHMG